MTQLDPEARRIVALARSARTPSAADRQRVRQRIALAAAGSLAAGAAADVAHASKGAVALKALGALGSAKLYVASALIVLAGAAGYALVPASSGRDAAPGVVVGTAPREQEKPAAPEPAVPPTAASEPKPASTPTPAPERPVSRREVTKRSRSALPLRAASDSAALVRELDLLHGAQSAWRARDSVRTLSLLDQHAREYPKSELREERAGLRVLALCELGRRAEARRHAEALIRRAPRSPVLATIEESCAFQ